MGHKYVHMSVIPKPKKFIGALFSLYFLSTVVYSQEIPHLDTLTSHTGLKMYLLQHGEDSVLTIRLVINGGKKNETKCQVGYSDVIQRLISETLKNKWNRTVEKEYWLTCKLIRGQTIVSGNCHRQNLDKEMAFLSTTLSRLPFNREQIDVIVASICASYHPETISEFKLSTVYRNFLLFGSQHPMGRNYCQYQLQKALPGQLREFYESHYTPQKTSLLICGNLNLRLTKKIITKHFIKWRSLHTVDDEERDTDRITPLFKGRQIALVNKTNATQCLLKWVQPAPGSSSPEQLAFSVTRDLFNNYLTSEIKKTSPGGLWVKSPVYAPGFFELNGVASHSMIIAAIHWFDTLLQHFQKTEITETVLEELKQKLVATYRNNSTPERVLTFYDPLTYDFDQRTNYISLLSRIGTLDIQHVIKKYFNADTYQLIIVGKAHVLSTQLNLLNHVTNYQTMDFETCDEACKEVVIVKCHCMDCWRRGQCHLWRFDPSEKDAIKNAKSRAKASMKQ